MGCMQLDAIQTNDGLVQPGFTPEGVYTLCYKPESPSSQALICGPIGYQGVIATRALNQLARQLAKATIASWRFDYRGTGESAGDTFTSSSMLEDRQSVASLFLTGDRRCGTIGAGFGAYPALYGSEGEDFLVLWDPVVSGETYAENILTDSKRHMFRHFVPWAPIELQGFTYTRELLNSISRIRLDRYESTVPPRTLIYAHQDLPDIDRLASCLRALGSDTSTVRHDGEVLGNGSLVTMPTAAIREIVAWI